MLKLLALLALLGAGSLFAAAREKPPTTPPVPHVDLPLV